jgi:hypothetical protein
MPAKWGVVGQIDEWFIWLDMDDKVVWACLEGATINNCSRPKHRLDHHVGIQVHYGDRWFDTSLANATLKVIKWIGKEGTEYLAKQAQIRNSTIEQPKAVRKLIAISGGKVLE